MISFACSQCGMQFQVKDEFAGRSTRCPTCKHPMLVPDSHRNGTEATPARAENGNQLSPVVGNVTASLPPAAGSSSTEPSFAAEVPVGRPSTVGRYVIESEIARGGMGAVVRAVDQDIRREVAIKLMLDERDPLKKARFIEEAQITGQLEHPNIVPVHELGLDAQKRYFFAMKMVRGRSLADIIRELNDDPKSARQWTLGRLLNILVGVCHALAYAHSRGVIHRDLKPANVMVGDFGEVYVMDWGLAKVLAGSKSKAPDALPIAFAATPERIAAIKPVVSAREAEEERTQEGAILGTPAYLSPEQALGKIDSLDQRSDIYALGGILYALLTLQPPIEKCDDQLSLLLRVAEGAIKPPAERAPQRAGLIPPELSAIALKALAKNPEDRYQTVDAFQRDLELFQEGRSVSAKQDSKWELAIKFIKRNKGFSIASLIGALLLVTVLVGSSWINYQARLRADEARRQAERTYDDLVQEQQAKQEQAKKSAPAFLRAARLTINDKEFADALTQVNAALEYDPGLTEGYLLKGQLLLTLERYAEAAVALGEYGKRKPGDSLAQQLMALAERPDPTKASYFLSLSDLLRKQHASILAGYMTHLAERFIQLQRDKLSLFQKRIDVAWPGLGGRLHLVSEEYHLALGGIHPVVSDLTPLRGMPLANLNLRDTKVENLDPLRGMALVSLDLGGCKAIRDLTPLKGMSLKFLDVSWLEDLTSLEPLRSMPLQRLLMRGCGNITTLEPLRGMPLTELYMPQCERISDLRPLKGMKLQALTISYDWRISDLSPLHDQPLVSLGMSGFTQLRELEPLRNLKKLTMLDLSECGIENLAMLQGLALTSLKLRGCQRIKSLAPLHGMPLTNLELDVCVEIRDIEALKGMRLNSLSLRETKVSDLKPLNGMPLQTLVLDGAPIRDLEPLRGMKLQSLRLLGCTGIRDLSALESMELKQIALSPVLIPKKNLEVLRRLKRLEFVTVDGDRRFETAEFWKLYEEGKFNK